MVNTVQNDPDACTIFHTIKLYSHLHCTSTKITILMDASCMCLMLVPWRVLPSPWGR
jgi:hypothetical protein